jgi:FkbM family methyltransferase
MWFSETFNEKEMLSGVLSRVRDGDVFLDVGSNLGLFTVFAAKVVGPGGTVVAFEPQTSAHNRLAENIRLNDLQNVKLFKLALSDTRATRKLILGDAGGFSPTAHLADESGPSEVVKTAEYDWLVANESLPIPNVVKMDIEGHEFAALKGMRATLSNPLCTALFCEVHPSALPKDVSREHVIELIQSFGFSSIRMKKRFAEFHIVATRQTTSPAQSHGARVEATA